VNISLSSKGNGSFFNTFLEPNNLKIRISPKYKTSNETIKKHYYYKLPKTYEKNEKNNDSQDNRYNIIKNRIEFMNIKTTFKNKYHSFTTQKYCLPHKKYQNINNVLKANFSETKKQ
jgi:hypothetical protein